MKSNKQRRAEIKAHRLVHAARAEEKMRASYRRRDVFPRALGIEPADLGVLIRHNNTCGPLPRYYAARPFICRDCGAEEIWTAKQQKWWYEVVHGSIESSAVRCLACRRARRASRAPSHEGKGANLLGEASGRLRVLARSGPTAHARAAVDAGLESKWWSLRTLAIKVLGHWGANEDVARLRALVDANSSSRGSWEREGANEAAKALAGCLGHPADEAWAVETCLRGNANPWQWHTFLGRIAGERIAANAKAEFARRPEDWPRLVNMLALMRCVGQSPSPHQMSIVRAHPRREVSQWVEYFSSEVA